MEYLSVTRKESKSVPLPNRYEVLIKTTTLTSDTVDLIGNQPSQLSPSEMFCATGQLKEALECFEEKTRS